MAALPQLITVEQFRQMPEGEFQYELHHGEVVAMTRHVCAGRFGIPGRLRLAVMGQAPNILGRTEDTTLVSGNHKSRGAHRHEIGTRGANAPEADRLRVYRTRAQFAFGEVRRERLKSGL
jgi:hypothetical protein